MPAQVITRADKRTSGQADGRTSGRADTVKQGLISAAEIVARRSASANNLTDGGSNGTAASATRWA